MSVPAIELVLKVLLGRGVNGGWLLRRENRHHKLTVLYDQLETRDSRATSLLDEIFQRTVMVRGDPKFGEFRNPMLWKSRGPITVKLMACDDITTPAAKGLRDQLALMDMNSTYGQAYLGDAVQVFNVFPLFRRRASRRKFSLAGK